MLIKGTDRSSRIATCLEAAPIFLLSRPDAIQIVAAFINKIGEHWQETCAAAELGETDRRLLGGRQFLNPYAFEGLATDAAHLVDLGAVVRQRLSSPP